MVVLTQVDPRAQTAMLAGQAADVTEVAMLVRFSLHRWAGVKHDKEVSDEIAVRKGASADAGDYKKRLATSDLKTRLRQLADLIYAEHRRRTLPWMDASGKAPGPRILSAKGYWDYRQTMDALIVQYDDLADQFEVEYPALVRADQIRLNGMFRSADYPKQRQIRGLFSAGYKVLPIPSAGDFRVELSAGETARIRGEIEAQVKEGFEAGMQTVWARLKDVVSKMSARLSAYNDQGPRVTGVFRDTLVENVRDLVEILPTLNVTGDPVLDLFTQEVKDKLLKHDAETLRDSITARRETRDDADEILHKMSDFIG